MIFYRPAEMKFQVFNASFTDFLRFHNLEATAQASETVSFRSHCTLDSVKYQTTILKRCIHQWIQ